MDVHAVRMIGVGLLRAHPANANVMRRGVLEKLKRHLKAGGRYEPLVVRKHPKEAGAYELINGHHRKLALEELGHTEVACLVWDLDDAQTLMLLATINRLSGEDAAGKRLALLEALGKSMGREVSDLAAVLPEDKGVLKAIAAERPALREAPAVGEMLEAFTVFLKKEEKRRLIAALRATDEKLSRALMRWADEVEGKGSKGKG